MEEVYGFLHLFQLSFSGRPQNASRLWPLTCSALTGNRALLSLEMKTASQTRLVAVLLAVLTLALTGLAIANLVQELSYDAPTDGVVWTETPGGLRAQIVPADTPAERAGIRVGDVLTAINNSPTPRLAAAEQAIDQSGVWSHATYSLLRTAARARPPAALEIGVYLEPADRSDHQVLRVIALVYLAIGLYVLFRRWTAPQATHFFIFCLTSFVLYGFKYTGLLDGLDEVIFWGEIVATALQPALFLHFALSFSRPAGSVPLRRIGRALLYLPGAVLVWLRFRSLTEWSVTGLLQHRLDQMEFIYLAGFYVLAAAVFWVRYSRETKPLERQQLKWLTRGTLLTVTPFTVLYVIPYLADWNVPPVLAKVALLSLLLLPLTFSWAIVRYRLMDVDLIFKRGVAYTLATAALVGLYFGVIALSAEVVHKRLQQSPHLRLWGLLAAVIVTGLIFDPLKRAIQARVDRIFDQKRVDYREALVEFGRGLNAQTDLNALVHSIVERLESTLLVTKVAIFLAEEGYSVRTPRFTLAASHGLPAGLAEAPLDLGFLSFENGDQPTHIFFETPQAMLRLPEAERWTSAALDLNYYVPCRAARHESGGQGTVAVLGLGRTGTGDFLSSEDMELLESLAGYIGIAIQNAQLYRRLEQKIQDFERLRDFNENIVESINVGVFALDPEDRIESWNAQMELMHGRMRSEVIRRPAREVFSPEFADELDRLRSEQGVHTLYKFRLPLPNGEVHTANITLAPLLNRALEAVGRIVILDDISDQVSMEAQLTQAEKLSSIGLLAAGVAHEVNTPLAVISSYTQMLGKQLRMDETAQARLGPVIEKITQQTFRASEIVNGLLNFSRTGTVEFSRVDLNQIVRETVLLLEHQMRSSGVQVTTDLAPDLPAISGNRGKLQQVLVNLVLNARDALNDRPAPVISLTTQVTGQQIELRVSDNGAGMPPEILRKIYDPFFTTKLQPREGQRKGTGLGLAVTYGIMQEHSGTIDATSDVDQGTAFRLLFPALDASRDLRPRELPTPTGVTAGQATQRGSEVHA